MSYYIIKTKEGLFKKVYAVCDPWFPGDPEEFCEFGYSSKRYKPSEVEVVEFPTRHGQRRTYNYIGVDIELSD